MTIAYLFIGDSDFFFFETALITAVFIFKQVNIRPDGKRPTLACLTACYLAMFGEYAKCLQNDGQSVEDWIKLKTNWQHLWKESLTQYEPQQLSGAGDMGGLNIPTDLLSMVQTNSCLVKSLQGHFDRDMQQFTGAMASSGGDGSANRDGEN